MAVNFTITSTYKEVYQVEFIRNSEVGEPDNDIETITFASEKEALDFISDEDIFLTEFIKITNLKTS